MIAAVCGHLEEYFCCSVKSPQRDVDLVIKSNVIDDNESKLLNSSPFLRCAFMAYTAKE